MALDEYTKDVLETLETVEGRSHQLVGDRKAAALLWEQEMGFPPALPRDSSSLAQEKLTVHKPFQEHQMHQRIFS